MMRGIILFNLEVLIIKIIMILMKIKDEGNDDIYTYDSLTPYLMWY
jgi:hypothetical protein